MSILVTINLVVFNGEKYIRHCLDSVKKQTYDSIEVSIWDNGSTDKTVEIVESGYKEFRLFKSSKNLGMWPAHEELWKINSGKYAVVLSVDVILDPNFIKNAVETMEKDQKIGASQARIYQWHLGPDKQPVFTDIIDTLGFRIFKSRRIINIGHGEENKPEYNQTREIFAVEGAAPIFRRTALEDCRICFLKMF